MDLEKIQRKIFEIRGCRVILDFHLAELYKVETRALKQAVRRNMDRFPDDFMFELTKDEWQEVITNCDNLPETVKFSPSMPYAFAEQGVAMLSSVLRSSTAIQVNIAIMRAFVLMRRMIAGYEELLRRIEELEISTDAQFSEIYLALTELLSKKLSDEKPRRQIGFHISNEPFENQSKKEQP
jgi:hypothetical protein